VSVGREKCEREETGLAAAEMRHANFLAKKGAIFGQIESMNIAQFGNLILTKAKQQA